MAGHRARQTLEIMSDTEQEEKPRDVNDVLLVIGEPGYYQIWMFLWIAVATFFASSIYILPIFTQADMNFRCIDSGWEVYRNESLEANQTVNECMLNGTRCNKFEYWSENFTSTIISEFDLVCGREHLATLSTTLYVAANIPGTLLGNALNDRFGRKRIGLVYLFILAASGTICSFSVHIYMYMIFRLICAAPILGMYNGFGTLIMEGTAPSKRPQLVIGVIYFWGAGIIGLSGLAYLIRSWKYLVLATSIPIAFLGIAFFWILDESPHWLYGKGRIEEAQKVINKMARWNNFNGEPHLIRLSATKSRIKKHEDGLLTIFRAILKAKRILITIAIASYCWVATEMGYTGLSFGLSNLAGDVYTNNAIGGIVEFVASTICFLVLVAGRKKIYILLSAVGGVALILSAIFYRYLGDIKELGLAMFMIGKFAVAANWQILFMWCLELYPTSIRTTLLSISMVLANIGAACTPFLNDAYKRSSGDDRANKKMLGPLFYGCGFIIAAIMAIWLPETHRRPLPITIEDANKFRFREKQTGDVVEMEKLKRDDAMDDDAMELPCIS